MERDVVARDVGANDYDRMMALLCHGDRSFVAAAGEAQACTVDAEDDGNEDGADDAEGQRVGGEPCNDGGGGEVVGAASDGH